ncbi:hypothetical protein [Pedococcus sp. 5OH_020]|uniref:hypothetical protein n=1 Tax=Pedococcus sp. 5OH_020 TaxID=2989814 RepID=UPI0022E9FB69|nr:hypothetical protein [Pedococcus sp. 5OH_020]
MHRVRLGGGVHGRQSVILRQHYEGAFGGNGHVVGQPFDGIGAQVLGLGDQQVVPLAPG